MKEERVNYILLEEEPWEKSVWRYGIYRDDDDNIFLDFVDITIYEELTEIERINLENIIESLILKLKFETEDFKTVSIEKKDMLLTTESLDRKGHGVEIPVCSYDIDLTFPSFKLKEYEKHNFNYIGYFHTKEEYELTKVLYYD